MTCPRPPGFILIALAFLAGSVLLLAACGGVAPAPRPDVPAADEAQRLRSLEPPAAAEVRDLRAQELAAQSAAAQADAAGDRAQALYQHRLAEALGRIRAAAEQRERDQRTQIAALAADADRRAGAERAEMDRRAAAQQRADDVRQAAERRLADRRWAGWGIAIAVAASVALRIIGLPALVSVGMPAAVGAGCATLAAWSSVPWLATALGLVLAGGILIALAVLARYLVHEWRDYAYRLGQVYPGGRDLADAASRLRQPPWVRWIVDHLLLAGQRPRVAASNRTPAPAPAPSA